MSSESIDNKVFSKIKKAKKGSLFFIEDFLRFGNAKAVSKALERLVNKGSVHRVARGIYARLEIHPEFGPLVPTAETIAKAVAKRDKAKIIPSGALALNLLGLSTQVPMNAVYLTDGSSRSVKIGNRTIKFKRVAPRNLAAIGELSGMVIQALKALGKDNLDKKREGQVIDLLKKEDPYRLAHDMVLAPEWIRVIMRKAQQNNE